MNKNSIGICSQLNYNSHSYSTQRYCYMGIGIGIMMWIGPWWMMVIVCISSIGSIGGNYGIVWWMLIERFIGVMVTNWRVSIVFMYMCVSFIGQLLWMKFCVASTIVVGNIIDIYIFGFIGVSIHWLILFVMFGAGLFSFLFFSFLHSLELFLCLIAGLEFFSSFFQTITLSNRLSINVFAGSLLLGLLFTGVFLGINFVFVGSVFAGLIAVFSVSLILLSIFGFEFLNTFIQWFLFCVLFLSYSLS